MVVLATGARSASHGRTCRTNTSTCVAGPFGLTSLRLHVSGVVTGHRHVHRGFRSRASFSMRSRRCDGPSRLFVGDLVRGIGRRVVSDSCNERRLTTSLYVDDDALCGGLHTVAKRGIASFVADVHVGRTYHVVHGGPGVHVGRLYCSMNFDAPECFDLYFGGRFNVKIGSCTRDIVRGEGRRR